MLKVRNPFLCGTYTLRHTGHRAKALLRMLNWKNKYFKSNSYHKNTAIFNKWAVQYATSTLSTVFVLLNAHCAEVMIGCAFIYRQQKTHHEFHETCPNDAVTPQCQSQFTPKMKANAVLCLLSSLVWLISTMNITEWQVSWDS